ncbi:MAG: rod-binding protein [Acidobacteriota bacterium]
MDFGIGTQINPLAAVQRGAGERQRRPSIEEVAQQFEAVFVAQLLKVMRRSVESSGLFGEGFAGKQIHLEMMDQELALELVRQGGFGLADQIRHYLEEAQQQAGAEEKLAEMSQKR